MSRITGLGDYKKKAASHDESDDEGPARGGGGGNGKPQSFYTGGTSSGLAVQDPKKGKGTGKDAVDDIMKMQGVGGAAGGDSKPDLIVKFWKNGFTISQPDGADGELRSYDTPEGKEFMGYITQGRVPPELRGQLADGDRDVAVEDHRGEDFTPPAYRAFSGSGAAIGGGGAAPASAVVRGGGAGAASIVVDPGAPKTTIQVKLANGKRETVELNLGHTVGDLQAKVASFNATGGKPFVLKAGFPPKALDVAAATLEAAGLNRGMVQQFAV